MPIFKKDTENDSYSEYVLKTISKYWIIKGKAVKSLF